MAVPTLVGAWTQSGTATVTKPSGGTTGDIYIVMAQVINAGTSPTLACSGFTSIGQSGNDGGGEVIWGTWFYRVYDGSESATFTVTGEGAGSPGWQTAANIVRGADTGTTPLSSSGSSVAGADSPYSCPGITVVTADTLGLLRFGPGADAPTAAPTVSGWTTSFDQPTYHASQVLIKTLGTGATGSLSIVVAAWQFGGAGSATTQGVIGFAPTAVGYIHTTITIPSQARFRSVFQ